MQQYFKKQRPALSADEMIYGIRTVMEAITAGKAIDKILIQNGLQGDLIRELKILIHQCELPYQYVPIEKLDHITQKNHQGVICLISPIRYQPLQQIVPMIYEDGKTPLILILDRITDVRNFGAIARSAECAGAHAIVIPEKGTVRITNDAIKTSAGALYNIPVCRESNLKDTIQYLKDCGIRILACTEKGELNYSKTNMSAPLAIILGSEEDGISPEYLKLSDEKTFIPMLGNIGSLNVSVAAGILLFEAIRQRNDVD